MADVRWKDKPQLVALAGTEVLAGTSVAGGAKVGGGTVPANGDIGVTTGQILAAAAAAADDAIADAIAELSPSGVSIGVRYLADTSSTSDADPGAGNLRFNHATQASATQVFLDDETVGSTSLTGLWAALDAGGFLYLQHAADQDIWSINEITAVVDASGYAKLTITRLTGEGSFADNDPMLVTIEQGQSGSGPAVDLVNTPSNASGTVTLDFGGASRYIGSITLGANVTTLAFSNLPGSGKFAEYELHIAQDGTGGRTFAIPASHKALGGSDTAIASAASKLTVLSASTIDNGTTWRYAMQESA